ncbi:MAG TPA: dTMP kinase [Candidatus Saccharimonadales bacterium]|nr:dTMP kinase [Candidatus Saccharimonadales bacterium]
MLYHVAFDIDFRRNSGKGLYIAIEGIDGSGKTTQVNELVSHFESLGKEVIKTGEPRKGVGFVGKLIQDVLLGKVKIPPVAFQYLMSAERSIHHEELILPALQAGKVVISDRCFWSAVPYGILDRIMGKGGEYDLKNAEIILCAQSILSMYHEFTVPDLTIYLNVSMETAIARLQKLHKEKEIYEKADKLEKVVSGYMWLLERFPKEITSVNAEQSVEQITKQIIGNISAYGK